ncbi:MAG: hypothetical protein ACXABY_35060 [Candidatus Thorarchaeota archaeon]
MGIVIKLQSWKDYQDGLITREEMLEGKTFYRWTRPILQIDEDIGVADPLVAKTTASLYALHAMRKLFKRDKGLAMAFYVEHKAMFHEDMSWDDIRRSLEEEMRDD